MKDKKRMEIKKEHLICQQHTASVGGGKFGHEHKRFKIFKSVCLSVCLPLSFSGLSLILRIIIIMTRQYITITITRIAGRRTLT